MRDREGTKERILGAVGKILAESGFHGIGINAVAREAGVDKVLIYRYFGGLPELLRSFGTSGEFWPTWEEITGGDVAALRAQPPAQRAATLICNFAWALQQRPLTQEILAWETVERNELTEVLEKVREDFSVRLFEEFGGGIEEIDADVAAITALLGAAINYLVVRSRNIRVFNTVDISTDAGWQRLESAIFTICERCFTSKKKE